MSKGTYLAARYRRITTTRGPGVAKVAIERKLIEAAWHVLSTGQPYVELGVDYYERRRPGHVLAAAINRVRQAGYMVASTIEGTITINPAPMVQLTSA